MSPEFANRVCEKAAHNLASGKNFTINGMQADARMAQQDAPPTMNASLPIVMPDKDVAGEVLCELNTQHASVTYVRITRGPTTQAEADFLRSQGACDQ
jgi:hypothetical protein